MEKKTMGSFMAALRKANGLTQQQVADKLNISNKTVSKWECDDGYPEITMLPAIAEIYSVTVDELLRGEIIHKENTNNEKQNPKAEKQALYLFNSATNKYSMLTIVSLILCGVASFIAPLLYEYFIGMTLPVLLVGAALITETVALKNYKYILKQADISIDADLITNSKKKIRRYLIAFFPMAVIPLIIVVLCLVWPFDTFFVSGIIILVLLTLSFFLYALLTKKLSLANKIDGKYISFRNIIIKVVVCLVFTTFLLCCVTPFAEQYKYDKQPIKLSFADAFRPETDYYKIKDHILNGKDLYYCSMGYISPIPQIEVQKINIETSEENGTIYIIDVTEGKKTHKIFQTSEELNQFTENWVIERNIYEELRLTDTNTISFNDSDLTITTTKAKIDWYKARNNLPSYILIGSVISVIITGTGMVLCFRKREKI